jgi:hypothetical protein
MRILTLVCLSFVFVAGCTCQHSQSPPPPQSESKSAAEECSTDECCSSATRAAVLKKSLDKDQSE